MDKNVVYIEKNGSIASIVLNQPSKKNAISAIMMDMLVEALHELEQDDEVRVIALRGEGENFCAGGDLDQPGPKPMTAEFSRQSLRRYLRAIKELRATSKPVVALVKGYAVGGAVSLVLACDLVCLSENCRIIPNFCKIGIIPEMGMMSTLPAIVGPQKAKEIMFFGDKLSAEECLNLGIANRVFSEEGFENDAATFLEKLCSLPNLSLRITKGIMNSGMDTQLSAIMDAESIASPFCSQGEEFKATLAKFQKK